MTPSLSSNTPTNTQKSQLQRQDSDDPKEACNDLTATKKRKRLSGRPLLSFAQLKSRKAAREAASRSKNAWKFPPQQTEASTASILKTTQSKRRNGSSALEQLPIELLERIFLYALETNFCRASPFLASAVSSERIYRTLIRLAFFKDTEHEGNCLPVPGRRQRVKTARERIAEALKPADYNMRLDETDRANLQATILRCRWCTKKRILVQLPVLTQMNIWKHWVGTGIEISDPVGQTTLDDFLSVRGHETLRTFPTAYTSPLEGTGPDGSTYSMSIKPLRWINIFRWTPKRASICPRAMNIRIIPDYLLRGRRTGDGKEWCFAEEDLDLLELFRQQYDWCGTGHDVSFSRNALQSGIQTAITSQNMRALTSLLKVDELFFRQRSTHDPPPGYANQHTGQYYAIPEDHFLQAIRLPMPEAMHSFILLLRCNAESMPPDSSELTQWAMELSSYHENNEIDEAVQLFGEWLLDFMIELPGYIDEARQVPREKALFYHGELNTQSRMGKRFRDEVCDRLPFTSWDNYHQPWFFEYSYDVSTSWSTDIQ
ncbi:hypothetical protein TMatcc_004865 [Talaromyces marneffei ATCC 18224]|uniref:F-box domain-containing protein n=1 Tax=Talaromyces marneffei (strain ATCC 18224 / CBS 334.59 / QM 7333) TaxID=441960 RepID=B6Q1W5_TALMQ|nr:uncharacterized protein EYB26_000215 [Talaromyces marneffei]EEA26849.1 conserved hypothetical protein [Talaromyces marneffei ATCC 18224]QGA12571.1 hypothetical protein EYB26_000215 [Talaromyces marneffei]